MALAISAACAMACSGPQFTPESVADADHQQVTRVEPLSWWTGMKTDLQLLIQGEAISGYEVNIKGGKGVSVKEIHKADSPNYLFVDVRIDASAKPGTYYIVFTKGEESFKYPYEIAARREGSAERLSFTTKDLIYLIMPDRFVDGDESLDAVPRNMESVDKEAFFGRHGGDIAGIRSQLDYMADLGVTAIWNTPLLEDNEPAASYHGYACSDYYHIDPRYGSNELYCSMVEKAHEKGIKVLMDMVPNHCGSTHWWMKDLPYHDWINQFDEFTTTSNVFSANYDINASEYDRKLSNRGWFDKPMPDMNLENPDLLKYFQQWAIWWIEYANLDGLRVDTYPYIEPVPGSKWLKAIREEYPNINIVGECWTRPASAVAYWQSGVKNYNGFDSNLPTVMDFPVEESIRQALENDGKEWGAGLTRVYDAVAQDYLYADVNKLFMFLGNHDMDRFADIVKDHDPRRVKLGYVLLATMRGIPQVFAGDEYAMRSADRSIGHSALRMPLPLGKDVTPQQQEMFDFQSRLFQWRKGEPVIHTGRTMHFMGRDNTYAFFRYNTDEAVFVFVNASEEERVIPMDHYAEITGKYQPQGTEILTDTTVDMTKPCTIAPLSAMIVKLLHK